MLLFQAEPLKLQYLILDKEKLQTTQEEESSADPVLDVLPEAGQPPTENPPPSVSGTSADLPLSDILSSPGPDDPLEGKSTIALPASTTDLETPVPPTPPEPCKVPRKSTAKKKRGRKPKSSSESSKTVADDTHLEKNNVESVAPTKPTSPATNTRATSVVEDHKSSKKRGRKRKSDSVLFVASADEKKDEFQSKKRSSRISGGSVEDVVSANDVGVGNQDKSTMKKPKALAPENQGPSVPDSVVAEHKTLEDGDKQLAKVDEVSNSCENRIGTLKISLDGHNIVRNVTSQKDHADLRLVEEKKGHSEETNLTKGQYRLKRKDDLRVQLSRKIKPQGDEDVSQEKPPELIVDRKKTGSKTKKTTQLPQRTRKRVEASKIEVSDSVDDDYLNVAVARTVDKKCTRVVQKLSSLGEDGTSETELYRRSSVIRKKRSPSITETPSPVVYDRDIETLPFLKRGNDKKVSRFLGRKSVLGKIPKAVSISTIPPTFVLAAERKQGNQNGEKKTIGDREPVSLKVVLRMVDDRKHLSVAHDRTDDCFMVSSTVADDEAELAGAGSGNSLDESPDMCESRPALDKRTVSACSEPTRLQPSVVSELSPFVHLVSDPPSSATPNKNPTASDALRPLPSIGSSAIELEGNKPLVPSTGSVVSGKVDRGAKRKRLESVISSLKPVASVPVLVSTDPVQHHAPPPPPPQPPSQTSIPNVATAATRDPITKTKFTPPAGFTQRPEKPSDTTPSLLHRLVSREPLNIPVPPMRHQWQPLRGAVYPPAARFPPGSHYPARAPGQMREPRITTQRQQHPRAPRRAPVGQQQQQQVRAVRYPTATNAHIAAAYAMGLLQAQRQTRPSVYHRGGWTPEQEQRLRFFAAGANDVRAGIVRTQPPEPNGYDAPLELTTKKSRDVST